MGYFLMAYLEYQKKEKNNFSFQKLAKVDSKGNHSHWGHQRPVRKCFFAALHLFNRFFTEIIDI